MSVLGTKINIWERYDLGRYDIGDDYAVFYYDTGERNHWFDEQLLTYTPDGSIMRYGIGGIQFDLNYRYWGQIWNEDTHDYEPGLLWNGATHGWNQAPAFGYARICSNSGNVGTLYEVDNPSGTTTVNNAIQVFRTPQTVLDIMPYVNGTQSAEWRDAGRSSLANDWWRMDTDSNAWEMPGMKLIRGYDNELEDSNLERWENKRVWVVFKKMKLDSPAAEGSGEVYYGVKFFNLLFGKKAEAPAPPVQSVYINIPPPVMNSRLSFTDQ